MRLNTKTTVKIEPGFSLLELMIAVTIIAVLASIAIPSYREHLVKAEITNAMSVLDGLKIKFIEHYSREGTSNPGETNFPALDKMNHIKYIRSTQNFGNMNTNNTPGLVGRLSIRFPDPVPNNFPSELRGKTLNLVAIDNGETITWICVSGSDSTTIIDLKYLPKSCRAYN